MDLNFSRPSFLDDVVRVLKKTTNSFLMISLSVKVSNIVN